MRCTWSVPAALFVLALGVGTAAAQERTVTGTVTDSAAQQPVVGAEIVVKGTLIRVTTRENGSFILTRAPSGPFTMVVRAIGYHRQEVAVADGQGIVNLALGRDLFRVEEVVITGQATGIEKQNLPNAVSTVGGDELTRSPSQTVESALQGKIPGALIQANSGAPGGGLQISLRGVSTINGNVDPLYVVDGIVISNEAIPVGLNSVTAASAGGNASNQDNPVSRIADLNPADIERIEVLKGGSAAAIYGSKATNGVVIITTKRGRAGRPTFSITQRLGTSRISNKLGARIFKDTTEAFTVYDPAKVRANFVPGQTTDFEELLFGRNTFNHETQASLSGGNDQTSYFVSGLVKRDEGIATNTGYEKQGIRVNLDQVLGTRFNVSVRSNLIHDLTQRGVSNNDNAGVSPYLVLPFTPSFWNPRKRAGADSFPDNPFERSNPLETFALLKAEEDVWRSLATVTTRFNAISSARHSLNFILVGGADYFNLRTDLLSPPELQFEPNDNQPGTVVLGKTSNLNLNLALNGTHTYTPVSGAFEATTSFGVQYERRELNAFTILGRTLLTGQGNVDQAASQSSGQDLQLAKDLGIYSQEEVLLLDRRLLLTGGLRADRSSNDGDPHKYYLYPKAASSYRLIKPFGGAEEIKLRAAYGQTGNQPTFGSKFSPDTTGTIGGRFGVLSGPRAGDPNIKPERQKEIEAGFDAQLLNHRAALSFTWYQRKISDLLLDQTLAPSTGQVTRIFNSGATLRNRGVEVALDLWPAHRDDFSWLFRTIFFRNRAIITRLPIPTFQTLGFGTSLGVFQIEQGKSATQIVGTEGVVGDANPDFQMSFSNDIQYKQLTLGFLFDWKQGGDVINLTQLLFDAGSNSADQPDGGAARFGRWLGGVTKTYVQDASYLKLREVTLSYDIPQSAVTRMFGSTVRTARVSLSGRNLLRFTGYDGLDPEVSNFGNQAIGRNIDTGPYPPSRSMFFSLDLGF
jgi:TonB-linked SusC/RagA family outer membrane protein